MPDYYFIKRNDMQSLKSLIAFFALILIILSGLFWFGDFSVKSSTLWMMRIVPLLVFFAIVYFLYWFEFVRTKESKISDDPGIPSADHTAISNEARMLLDEGGTIRDLITLMKDKKEACVVYATYTYEQSLQKANHTAIGDEYWITWTYKLNDTSVGLLHLVNLLSLPAGVWHSFYKLYRFQTLHRFSPGQARSLRLRKGFFNFLFGWPELSQLIFIIIVCCSIAHMIMSKSVTLFNSIFVFAGIAAVVFIQYLYRKSMDWGLSDDLKSISRGHFRFVNIQKK